MAGGLKRRARLLGSCILKLAYPLAYAPKQFGDSLSTKKQHQHEDDEDDGLRIAEEQKGEEKHEQVGKMAFAKWKKGEE